MEMSTYSSTPVTWVDTTLHGQNIGEVWICCCFFKVSSESQHANTFPEIHKLCVITVWTALTINCQLWVYWTILANRIKHANTWKHSIFLHTLSFFCTLHLHTACWHYGPIEPIFLSPPVTACLLSTAGGGGQAQVQRGDGNWFCIYQIPAWSLQRRKVGGMKCAGDLAVDFNCAFYDFLISYVRKMLRRM